jgi:hypothetical protein
MPAGTGVGAGVAAGSSGKGYEEEPLDPSEQGTKPP